MQRDHALRWLLAASLPGERSRVPPRHSLSVLHKLLPDDGKASDRFGLSVVINGSTVIVGAPGDADHGSNTGSAYLFGCACPADIDGDGAVNVSDLVEVITNWGACQGCPTDINADGAVDVGDLVEVVTNWGPCS